MPKEGSEQQSSDHRAVQRSNPLGTIAQRRASSVWLPGDFRWNSHGERINQPSPDVGKGNRCAKVQVSFCAGLAKNLGQLRGHELDMARCRCHARLRRQGRNKQLRWNISTEPQPALCSLRNPSVAAQTSRCPPDFQVMAGKLLKPFDQRATTVRL